MIDLLSPVGDFECLKAAVQNGASSVYFGANLFSARAYASNFDLEELKKAIIYAKIRGVKTNLTLNTLIKDDEFEDAFNLAKEAYEYGIDAIIVQDLGLAKMLINTFPDLPIHASTQMTIHNLQGVQKMEELGFKRVVLSRELSLHEIEYICQNTNIETEVFIHGALCISYSGQCLFSSMIGGRSGNRGKCAQSCRLPYKLMENKNQTNSEYLQQNLIENKKQINSEYLSKKIIEEKKEIDSGYLLSTRDLCGLDFIPDLIKAGVTCLKIEGRMKNPEYVAIVTKIYRKYINLTESGKPYIIDDEDRKILKQSFNRGNFSSGHLLDKPNKDLIYKEKPNNMGLFLGKVEKYNKSKGYITLKLQEKIAIGDTVSLENESGTYNVSELMQKSKNIKEGKIDQTVTIGRMKGKINLGDKVFKMSSKSLNELARESYKNENIKIPLDSKIIIKKGQPIELTISFNPKKYMHHNSLKDIQNLNINPNASRNTSNGDCKSDIILAEYSNLNKSFKSEIIPEDAKNKPLTKEKVIEQLHKTTDSIFEFKTIDVEIDDNVFVPKISAINELRRSALDFANSYAINNIQRNASNINVSQILNKFDFYCNSNTTYNINNNKNATQNSNSNTKIINKKNDISNTNNIVNNSKNTYKKQISLLLNILHENYDYSNLENFDNIYIPLKYFLNSKYEKIIKILEKNHNLYIYMPTILKANYRNMFYNCIEDNLKQFKIKGFVISNISNLKLLENIIDNKKYDIVANYTFNVFNKFSILELNELKINRFTISPESDKNILKSLCASSILPKELIVYGNIPLMNMNYCLIGKTNKCYPECDSKCNLTNKYYLKDRLNMNFRILFDNFQTVSTIYNSKTTSISTNTFDIDCARIDILDETIDEINKILNYVSSGKRLEGKEFTNGNLNRTI